MIEAEKRTIVITGGSRGIGRAVCKTFAGPDTVIFFNYSSSDEKAIETEKIVAKEGGTATGIKADVSSREEVNNFFKIVLEKTGRIDVLVNNAGIRKDGLLVFMKESDWDDVIDINLKGAFNCSKAVIKPMLKQRSGRIVNISSLVASTGNPGQCNYAAAKAGLIGFTKSLALELASRNITVNAVAPGLIDTEMVEDMSEKYKAAIIEKIPMKKTGSVTDISNAVEFLASENAGYITGQVLHVNGGMFV